MSGRLKIERKGVHVVRKLSFKINKMTQKFEEKGASENFSLERGIK